MQSEAPLSRTHPESGAVVLPPHAAEAQAVHGVEADAQADEQQSDAQGHEALPRRVRVVRDEGLVQVGGVRQGLGAALRAQHDAEGQQEGHAQGDEEGVEEAATRLRGQRRANA